MLYWKLKEYNPNLQIMEFYKKKYNTNDTLIQYTKIQAPLVLLTQLGLYKKSAKTAAHWLLQPI